MALKSINQLYKVRMALLGARRWWLAVRHGVSMHSTSSISLSGRVISGGRNSIVVGRDTLIAFKTLLIARDQAGVTRPIHIGDRCFIGGGSTVMPGVRIGDGTIIGSGSVVFDDIPPRCIAAGNPARVIRHDVEVGRRGLLKGTENWPDEML
ncbi:galactoside O-acetyltransferase [Novosphingobium sp. MD-1]|nr:galactoside O-acetyltransferase [Novosphingobium sp. MD-1]